MDIDSLLLGNVRRQLVENDKVMMRNILSSRTRDVVMKVLDDYADRDAKCHNKMSVVKEVF